MIEKGERERELERKKERERDRMQHWVLRNTSALKGQEKSS